MIFVIDSIIFACRYTEKFFKSTIIYNEINFEENLEKSEFFQQFQKNDFMGQSSDMAWK